MKVKIVRVQREKAPDVSELLGHEVADFLRPTFINVEYECEGKTRSTRLLVFSNHLKSEKSLLEFVKGWIKFELEQERQKREEEPVNLEEALESLKGKEFEA